MDESQIESQLNDLQTDEKELDEALAKYDLDEALEARINDLEKVDFATYNFITKLYSTQGNT
jgi:hypothetical protein